MALINCPDCGTELTTDMLEVNMCYECGYIIDKNLFDDTPSDDKPVSFLHSTQKIIEQEEYEVLKLNHKISQHTLTSGYNFEGYSIKKYNGIISGHVVMGTGFMSEVKASFSDVFGVQSDAFANKLENTKHLALNKLIAKSISLGGNAIIGVNFDYITFTNNMMGVSANGTSVIIEAIS